MGKNGCLVKVLGLCLVGFFVVTIGGYFWVKSYLRSEEATQILQHKLSEKLGGKVSLAPMQWEGWRLENEKMEVLAGKGFQDLEVSRAAVEIDPRGFTERVWRVSDVHVRELSLHLGASTEPPFVAGELPVTFDWRDAGKALLPRKAEVNSIWVENFHGSFANERAKGYWKGAELKLERESQDYLFNLPKGTIAITSLAPHQWSINQCKGRLKKDRSFYLHDGELSGLGSALIRFVGEGAFGGNMHFDGEVVDLPLEEVLEGDWKKRIMGQGQATFAVHLDPERGLIGKGTARVENGMLTALPALDTIAQKTGENRFRQMPLEPCLFDYRLAGDKITLENIDIRSKGLMRVTGRLEKEGEVIAGTLEVGLADAVMPKMPRGTETVFSRKGEQHHWATVQVKQVNGKWEEDLSARLLSAVTRAFLQNAPQEAANLLQNIGGSILGAQIASGQELNAEKSGEEGSDEKEKKAPIKQATDIIETGVKSLFDLLGQ